MTRAGLFAACAAVCAAAASVVSWQTETTSTATAAAAGPATGSQLFKSKGCATCHDAGGSTALIGGSFPSLVDAAEWAGERRPGMSAEEYMSESIRTPSAFISPAFNGTIAGTEGMPDLGLTEVEIEALVDHLLQG